MSTVCYVLFNVPYSIKFNESTRRLAHLLAGGISMCVCVWLPAAICTLSGGETRAKNGQENVWTRSKISVHAEVWYHPKTITLINLLPFKNKQLSVHFISIIIIHKKSLLIKNMNNSNLRKKIAKQNYLTTFLKQIKRRKWITVEWR